MLVNICRVGVRIDRRWRGSSSAKCWRGSCSVDHDVDAMVHATCQIANLVQYSHQGLLAMTTTMNSTTSRSWPSALFASRPLWPMYLHLLVSALLPIYKGAHASLSRPSSAAKPPKRRKRKNSDPVTSDSDDESDEENDDAQKMESLSPSDALVLPLTAGIVLAGLYWAIKRYGAGVINSVLGWYFAGVGVFSVARLTYDALDIATGFVWPRYMGSGGRVWEVLWAEDGKMRELDADGKPSAQNSAVAADIVQRPLWLRRVGTALRTPYSTRIQIPGVVSLTTRLNLLHLVSTLFAIATVSYATFIAKPWYLTNLQGLAVSYSALQFLSPTTFVTGSLVLMGLFFYDIWAVFFTPLMVTVAKNLDQPIKLVFPRPDDGNGRQYSMLGLGDIVLPGIMIGLALRFDLYLFYLRKAGGKAKYIPATGNHGSRFWTSSSKVATKFLQGSRFPKPYFTAAMVGYVAGMLATVGVMSVFDHAQPALLYLVPGVLGALWGTALVRGEVGAMWQFSEAEEEEETEEEKAKNAAEERAKNATEEKRKKGRSWYEWFREEVLGLASSSQQKEKADEKKDVNPAKKMEDDGVLFAIEVRRYVAKSKLLRHTPDDEPALVLNGKEA